MSCKPAPCLFIYPALHLANKLRNWHLGSSGLCDRRYRPLTAIYLHIISKFIEYDVEVRLSCNLSSCASILSVFCSCSCYYRELVDELIEDTFPIHMYTV